jgi:integrase/recombinase XerD
MGGPKGFVGAMKLAQRAKDKRGGNEKQRDTYERGQPDSLGRWHDTYLQSLLARNYAASSVEHRRFAIKVFMAWASERELNQAGQITRPILESYQRWLWRYTKANGQRLGWSSQRNHLAALKDWFRWLTRQNVILHNPASELEMPRPEKRLPQEVLTQTEVGQLLAIPDIQDPLGIRDRAMLELFYSTGIRRTELCRLDLSDLNTERRTLHVRLGKGRNYAKVVVMQR